MCFFYFRVYSQSKGYSGNSLLAYKNMASKWIKKVFIILFQSTCVERCMRAIHYITTMNSLINHLLPSPVNSSDLKY